MDDVDRLFQCFRCGVSPPQSAIRQRKKVKCTTSKGNESAPEASTSCSNLSPSPGSATKRHGNCVDTQLPLQSPSPSIVSRPNVNNKRQFSPLVFYGSPQGVPPKRPARLLRLLREICIDISEQNKLREEIWATFARQDDAMNYVKAHAHGYIFCYQDHVNGQRRFLVSTYKEFWQRYQQMNPKFRHHYEVIREGLPCHLYFDLEFSKRENVQKNGDKMVDLLLSVVFDALHEKYGVEGNDECVVELDSSTEEKFSRHLIIRLPETAFKDNSHVGAFVVENEEEVFMASLICNVDIDCRNFLICKMDLDCMKVLQFDSETNNESHRHSSFAHEFDLSTDVSRTYLMGQSLFPALDVFIEFVASTGNEKGKIRSWYWFSEYGLMVYSMSRNRYCERIGREHKSNHVMYVVDIRRGDYYQKCHDPDCRGYRSPLRPIPQNVIPDTPNFHHLAGQTEGHIETMSPTDENLVDSCKKAWSVRTADNAENIQKQLDLTSLADESGEDDNWWTAVEMTAYQTELMFIRQERQNPL